MIFLTGLRFPRGHTPQPHLVHPVRGLRLLPERGLADGLHGLRHRHDLPGVNVIKLFSFVADDEVS